MSRWRTAVKIAGGLATTCINGQSLVVDFEDVSLAVPPAAEYGGGGVYYNGSDLAGGFTSNGVNFDNLYNPQWFSWSGWAWSTTTDIATPGYTNQYSSFTGGANSGSVYGVAYLDAFNNLNPITIQLPDGWQSPQSLSVTNTTYAALTIRDGDGFGFASPFGQDDTFQLIIEGLTADNQVTGTIVHYLADYRGSEESHFIQDTWIDLDLSSLGSNVDRLSLKLESTDVGAGGMNTPAYLAVDDLVLGLTQVPEPSTWALFMGLVALVWVLRRRR